MKETKRSRGKVDNRQLAIDPFGPWSLVSGPCFSVQVHTSATVAYFSITGGKLVSVSLVSITGHDGIRDHAVVSTGLSSFAPFYPHMPLVVL